MMPKVIYVMLDPNADTHDDLLAWSSLESADEGRVAVYTLTEELEKREVVEVRKKGSKAWFKPRSGR
jgi:hypothetical protein